MRTSVCGAMGKVCIVIDVGQMYGAAAGRSILVTVVKILTFCACEAPDTQWGYLIFDSCDSLTGVQTTSAESFATITKETLEKFVTALELYFSNSLPTFAVDCSWSRICSSWAHRLKEEVCNSI